MARVIWNGVISFGMVSIPVGLQTATTERDLRFNQLHTVCGNRIKQQKFCPHCDRVVEADEIEKGYEIAKNTYVKLTEEDFEGLPVASKQTISIDRFVQVESIDPVYFDTTYYLAPSDTGKKPYALLSKTLQKKGLVAIGKISIRNKEVLCVLREVNGSVLLETLFWPDEIKEQEAYGLEDVKLSDGELQMASSLVDLLKGDFEPQNYEDEYRKELMARIEAKQMGGQVHTTAISAQEPASIVDLMEALRASIEAAQKNA